MIINAPKPCHEEELRNLWQEAFGDDDGFLDGFFSVGFSRERCLCLWQDTVLCAALYWFDCTWQDRKVAYLYAVATRRDQQGKGYCHRLMEKTHELLKAQGYAGSILVPGDESLFCFYGNMGYAPCCPMTKVEATAAQAAATLHQITATQYAKLQKDFLPPDSIFHSQLTLAFAGTFAKFYRGEDFACCGGKEDDVFYFQEFLGNEKHLPAILNALKVQKGIYRRTGGKSFAMYYPLDGSDLLPMQFDIPLN